MKEERGVQGENRQNRPKDCFQNGVVDGKRLQPIEVAVISLDDNIKRPAKPRRYAPAVFGLRGGANK